MSFFARAKGLEHYREAESYVAAQNNRRRRRRRFLVGSLTLFITGLFVVGATWAIIYSPLFHVQRWNIVGNQATSADTIRNYLDMKVLAASLPNAVLGYENMFSWRNAHYESYAPELPRVKEIEVDGAYLTRTISISVTERIPYGIWCAVSRPSPSGTEIMESGTQSCFWFDKEGVLLDAGPHADGNLIPVVHDYSGRYLRSQTKALNADLMKNLISVFDATSAMGVSVREVRIEDRELEEIKVILYGGPVLYFSLRFPATESVPVVMNLRRGGSGNQAFSNLQYVDFRVEHRAYYR